MPCNSARVYLCFSHRYCLARIALDWARAPLGGAGVPAINGIPFFDLFLGSFFGHHQFSKEQYVKLKRLEVERGNVLRRACSVGCKSQNPNPQKKLLSPEPLRPSKCIYNLRVFRKTYLHAIVSNSVYGDYFSHHGFRVYPLNRCWASASHVITIDVVLSNRAAILSQIT